MKRTDKMYGSGPKIVADESGKKVIQKGPSPAEKKSSEVNAGTDGIPVTERHVKEITELVERHAKELTESKQGD